METTTFTEISTNSRRTIKRSIEPLCELLHEMKMWEKECMTKILEEEFYKWSWPGEHDR